MKFVKQVFRLMSFDCVYKHSHIYTYNKCTSIDAHVIIFLKVVVVVVIQKLKRVVTGTHLCVISPLQAVFAGPGYTSAAAQ